MSIIEIREYTKNMIKSDYDLLVGELMPKDAYLFVEKYVNGRTNKDLKLSALRAKELNNRVIKAIHFIKSQKLEGISETLLRYRCRKLGKTEHEIQFAVDCFVNNMTRKNLAKKYFLAEETIKKYKSKLRKELQS